MFSTRNYKNELDGLELWADILPDGSFVYGSSRQNMGAISTNCYIMGVIRR